MISLSIAPGPESVSASIRQSIAALTADAANVELLEKQVGVQPTLGETSSCLKYFFQLANLKKQLIKKDKFITKIQEEHARETAEVTADKQLLTFEPVDILLLV